MTISILCKWIANRTPTPFGSRAAGAESELLGRPMHFFLWAETKSWLLLGTGGCGLYNGTSGSCLFLIKESHNVKDTEVIVPTSGDDPSSYVWFFWVTLEATLWAYLDELPHGARAFHTFYSNSKVSFEFFPAERWNGFPPLSSTVNFWVTILPLSVTWESDALLAFPW